jgi:protein ImuB
LRPEASPQDLDTLAASFSPLVERTSVDTAVFSIRGLKRLIGGLHDIASAISQRGQELGLEANLAIAANPDAAILAARALRGVTILTPGREIDWLGRIPAAAVATPEMTETLAGWGIATLGELAGLPPIGLAERLGPAAEELRRLARGEVSRPLRLPAAEAVYTAETELEHGLQSVEEILLALSPLIHTAAARMERNAQAAQRVQVKFHLEDRRECHRLYELSLPSRSAVLILQQVQLDLEAHSLGGRVIRMEVTLDPASPRTIQGGLYRPPSPEPDRLQNVLARLGALVGKENAGSPLILDTHRPGAFAVRPYELTIREGTAPMDSPLRLSLRIFRPPLSAKVRLERGRPVWLRASQLEGEVADAAGPWRTSGGWWAETGWQRDEWDVVLQGGDAYRLYLDGLARQWFVDGMYD